MGISTPVFIAALFTIAQIWTQTNAHQQMSGREAVIFVMGWLWNFDGWCNGFGWLV